MSVVFAPLGFFLFAAHHTNAWLAIGVHFFCSLFALHEEWQGNQPH
jgi:hypothetical protein